MRKSRAQKSIWMVHTTIRSPSRQVNFRPGTWGQPPFPREVLAMPLFPRVNRRLPRSKDPRTSYNGGSCHPFPASPLHRIILKHIALLPIHLVQSSLPLYLSYRCRRPSYVLHGEVLCLQCPDIV